MNSPLVNMSAPDPSAQKNGRDNVGWSPQVWQRIDKAVTEEITRSRVVAKFLPTVYVVPTQTTAPADAVSPPLPTIGGASFQVANALTSNEGETVRINEFFVEFAMTPRQVEEEGLEESLGEGASTAITLATRAANILAQVEDTVLLQGQNALLTPLFTGPPPATSPVGLRGTLTDLGLLNIIIPAGGGPGTPTLPNPPILVLQAQPISSAPAGPYQEKTLAAVAQGFSVLQANGHYGAYALVLFTFPYADAYSPLPATLITPADPIKELVTAGFYGTGTLPPGPGAVPTGLPTTVAPTDTPGPIAATLYTGVLVSPQGNTMDLVRGRMPGNMDVITAFEQQDAQGNYRFRVMERFALRLKDPTAVVLLQFLGSPTLTMTQSSTPAA